MADKIKILILAGGQGTRMKSDLPKVLIPVKNKPMIAHLLSAIQSSGVDDKPVVVVGYKREKVMKELGNSYTYVTQHEQLGTGHAVISAESALKNKAENVMVLPIDHPFITPETIKKLAHKHLESKAKITMATVELPDFNEWRSVFYNSFSRIVRDANGQIVKD